MESTSTALVLPADQKLGYLRGQDASAAVERIVKDSQSAYKSFAKWNIVKAEQRNVKAQFEVVNQQGRAFNETLMSSLDVSEQGRRLADEATFMCAKLEEGTPFDRAALLNGMIDQAKKGSNLARGVMQSFTEIRGNLVEVYSSIPEIARKVDSDMTEIATKLDKITRKIERKGMFFFLTGGIDRRNKAKAEAALEKLHGDKAEHTSLEGLDKVIDSVSILVDWWDQNVQRLEKLRDDGFDIRSDEIIDPKVAERMQYEWKVVNGQYTWYARKIKLLNQNFNARITQ